MKMVPGHLPPIPTSTNMDRLPLPLPFNTDILWRYSLGFPTLNHQNPPTSPLMDYKSQLPTSLPSDPRFWNRDDVVTFFQWAEREYDIQPIDQEMFQMNGKALCLLTRTDLSERAPGSGDVLYNVLQILIREANNLQRMLPSSPVTPTSRHPYPLPAHSHPPTPNWNILSQNAESLHSTHAASLAAHLMANSNSVTLSPAPSVDSQASSPQHADTQTIGHSIFSANGSNGSGSNPSDSDEDGGDKKVFSGSPPNTPSAFSLMPQMPYLPPWSPKEPVSSPGAFKREFFPNDSPEPNTNGRLLWDFLQQLLNDPAQRYTSYIAWKNQETGVFKIVDPSGLAKLWGIQKNHLSMNYDKMSRALRYYYRVNILRKVQGERHCYQFLRNPIELKNIKNISLLRQQMSPTATKAPSNPISNQVSVKSEQSNVSDHEVQSLHTVLEYDDEKLKTIKNLSLLRQQMSPTSTKAPSNPISNHVSIKSELLNTSDHEVQSLHTALEYVDEKLKNIKNISLLRQQMSPTTTEAPSNPISNHVSIKSELLNTSDHEVQSLHTAREYEDEKPTDLSMNGPTDLSNSTRHVNIVCSPDPPIMGPHHC